MYSESTRFLSQPSDTIKMFPILEKQGALQAPYRLNDSFFVDAFFFRQDMDHTGI